MNGKSDPFLAVEWWCLFDCVSLYWQLQRVKQSPGLHKLLLTNSSCVHG